MPFGGFSIDLPAGSIDSASGTFVVRTRGQAYSEQEFGSIPIRSADGAEILLGEVATIRDGFEEGDKRVEFNGRPALFIEVLRSGQESAIDIADKVRDYVDNAHLRFPKGIQLYVWDDESVAIRGRIRTLSESLIQGAVLLLLVLGLFLRPALACWIILGIPVGFAGGILLMPWFGITANVMSLFAYIIVVGIVVDDAIVTGENVYSKIKRGMPSIEAAVEGTHEVAVPVTFGALTTVVAFIPLMFFDGMWGDYASQVPPIVAPVLLFSLIESKLILPAHLKHLKLKHDTNFFTRMQSKIADGLERFVAHVYRPTLGWAVTNRPLVLSLFAAGAMLMTGYGLGGHLGFVQFPSVDRQRITVRLDLPDNTPLETTVRYADRVTKAIEQLESEYIDPGTGESLIRNTMRVTGAYRPSSRFSKSQAYLAFEVMDPGMRSEPGPRNSELAERLREIVGPIMEAKTFRIYSESSMSRWREYDDESINIELRGPSSPAKAAVGEQIKTLLESYEEISTAWARINFGQDELELKLKPRAAELGLTQALLAQQLRHAFFGEEAQRIQRGIDDVRVMVRLPDDARKSLHTLDELKIRTPRGANVPLATVADVSFTKAPSYVERNDRAEVLRIGGQPVDETVDVIGIAEDIEPKVRQLCQENDLSYEFLGYVAEAESSRMRTILGAVLLMVTLYAMLSVALKSIIQPIYVLLAVPFAVVGALLGHMYLDIVPSYLSIFGMLALAGIAVNDTLVMVDYVNRRRAEGVPLREAALDAGAKRFRPIMLTSVTTFVGLGPLLMDRSLQAQFLIPMAASLAFGVLFATCVTLYLIPCALVAGDDCGRFIRNGLGWYFAPWRAKTKHVRGVGKRATEAAAGE